MASDSGKDGPATESKNPLEGLADAWESCGKVRRRALDTQALLTWTSAKTVGICNMKSLKLNVPVMIQALKTWCPKARNKKTLPVDFVKLEARGSKCVNSSQVNEMNKILNSLPSGQELQEQDAIAR